MFGEPRLQTARDALRLRHSAETSGMVHYSLAFADRELAKQEVTLARSGSNPVGVTATGIEECRLCGPRSLPGKLDQLILDFERTQRLKILELHKFHGSFLSKIIAT